MLLQGIAPGTAYRVVRGSKPNRVRATCSPEYVDGDSAAWPDLDAWVAKNYPNG